MPFLQQQKICKALLQAVVTFYVALHTVFSGK